MKKAFTLMELLVVVLILGLLATIAVGVFTNQVERARYAAARTTIAAIELATTRYQLDVGEFPPSGSIDSDTGTFVFEGNGYLYQALTRSMNGNTSAPASARWQGPYLDVKKLNLGTLDGIPVDDLTSAPLAFGEVMILDPWGSPYRYVRCCGSADDNYAVNGGTELPDTNPYAATDIYYNPTTYQVYSNGPNGVTLPHPNRGLEEDDVNNFGF